MSEVKIPNFGKKIKPTKKQILILNNLRKCKKITDCIEYKLHNPTTERNYAGFIRNYFMYLNIENPDEYLQDPRRMENGKKIDYLDNIEKDVLKFNKSLQKKSGSHRKANLSAIRKLLEYNRIELGNSFWEDIRKNGKKAYRETETETPTKQQLKNILSRADTEAKAFFLMQMTSDSRLQEVLYLTFDNLHLETNPPSFRVPPELSKNGRPITKFITPEAKYWVEQYLKNRDKILQTRLNRARNKKTKEEYKNRVFPMGSTNPEIKWNNLVDKEGLYKIDPNTKYPIMGTHSLRRYFEDNIGHGKLAKYMSNKLSKSEEPYQYKTKNKLEQEYLKYMTNLYVFEETAETKEEIKNLKQELDKTNESLKSKEDYIKLIGERQKSDNQRIEHLEKLLTRLKYDDIDPFAGPKLTPEENDFEDKLEDKIIRETEQRLKKRLETDPKCKDYEIVYGGRTYDGKGNIITYGCPRLQKKEKYKKDEQSLFEHLGEHLGFLKKEAQVFELLLSMDDNKLQDLIKEVNNGNQDKGMTFKEARKIYQKNKELE